MSEHRHTWTPCTVRLPKGIQPGRKCHCGVVTVGGINADVVLAAQKFNNSVTEALTRLARAFNEERK